MEPLADHDLVGPAAAGVLARDVVSGRPAVPTDGTADRTALPGNPESLRPDGGVNVRQPFQLRHALISRLEHRVSRPPRCPLPARQRHRVDPLHAERCQHTRGRRQRRHRPTLPPPRRSATNPTPRTGRLRAHLPPVAGPMLGGARPRDYWLAPGSCPGYDPLARRRTREVEHVPQSCRPLGPGQHARYGSQKIGMPAAASGSHVLVCRGGELTAQFLEPSAGSAVSGI